MIFPELTLEIKIFLIAIFSLIFGSFAGLLSYRLAKNEPFVFTRSKCVNCSTTLKPWDLIPLFSWIFKKIFCGGKCKSCGTKISWRYLAIELSFLFSFLAIFFVFNQEISTKTILLFLVAGTLIVMCVVDLEEYFIPNSTQYFLAIIVTLLLILQGGNALVLTNLKAAFLYTLFGLALMGFFYLGAKIEALGIDDLKFFFIAGLALGMKIFLPFMILSGIFGVIFGTLWQKLKNDETFPFAPAMCLALFLCLLFGEKLNVMKWLENLLF
jgi:leader peptidase (prepilin peptidase)/N-methyltransferase